MSWWTAALLLLGCAASGALLGTAPPRIRTGWLVAAAAVGAVLVFLPGTCVTAIGSGPVAPADLSGRTSCWFL